MKIATCSLIILGALLLSLQPSRADGFAGNDSFTSLANWNTNPTVNGSPINTTTGNLKEENGQLHYTDSSSSTKDQNLWEWTPGMASSTDSWIMNMGVSNSVSTSSTSTAEIGIGIAKTGSLLTDNLDLTMANYHGTQGFRLNLTTGGTSTHYFDAASTTNASILLWFDQPNDDLHAWYNLSPTDPNFSVLADINLAQLWNLQPSDTLTFFVIGASTDQSVTTSPSAYGYNFSIQDLSASASPEPTTLDLLVWGVFGLSLLKWLGSDLIPQLPVRHRHR